MKPRRRAFEKAVSAGVLELGYEPVAGPRDLPETTLYWKRCGDLRLLLALEYHRFYDEHVTLSLYLGRSFTFALYPVGYPEGKGWRRIDGLLPELGHGFWWTNFDEASSAQLVDLVPAFERAFLAQPNLIDEVVAVDELSRREALETLIADQVRLSTDDDAMTLQTTGVRIPSSVPAIWFAVAERVLLESGNENDRRYIKNFLPEYAINAWRSAK